MDNSNGRNSRIRKVGLSILAGIGLAIVGFFAGAILFGLLMYLFFSIAMGGEIYGEAGPLMIIYLSPIIGVITAVIIGIIGGIKIHKRMSG